MSEEKSVRPGFFKGMTRLQKEIEKVVGPFTPEEKLAIRQGTKKLKQRLRDLAPFVEEASKPKATEKRKKAEAEAAASDQIGDLTRALRDVHSDSRREEIRRITDIVLPKSDELRSPSATEARSKAKEIGESLPPSGTRPPIVAEETKPLQWLKPKRDLIRIINRLFREGSIEGKDTRDALRRARDHFAVAGKERRTTKSGPLVWLKSQRAWGDEILKFYRACSIQATSQMNALDQAAKHFVRKNRESFNPRSVWQSIRNREEYQNPTKAGPR
jgi:hypothetical protein